MISSPAAGGAEIYVKDLSINMARSGYTLHILFLQSASDSGRDAGFESVYINEIEEAGITYSFIGVSARRKPWCGVSALRQAVQNFSPDVLHCHLYYGLFFSFFVFNVPVIYTHHSFSLKVPKALYRILDLKVSAYIGICRACEHLLASISRKRVVRINNGVSSRRLPRNAPDCVIERESKLTIVAVGRLCAPKNYALLFGACSYLLDLEFEVLIAGEGPDQTELNKLVAELQLGDVVKFLGNVKDVPALLETADLFVMSSAWEGLPIALLEATLMGLPVVVTNVGGCAEVVHEVCHGIVVEDQSPIEYAAALRKIMQDVELRRGFSRNARVYGKSFLIETAVMKHAQLYESLLK